MTIEQPKELRSPDESGGGAEVALTPEEIRLRTFLKSLWDISQNSVPVGAVNTIIRSDPVYGEFPRVEVPLAPQIARGFPSWLNLSDRVFVYSRKKIGIRALDTSIDPIGPRPYIKPPEVVKKGEPDTILLKKTRMSVVFDAEKKDSKSRPTDPQLGILQIRVDAFEVYDDTERAILETYERLKKLSEKKAEDFARRVAAELYGKPASALTAEQFEAIEGLDLLVLDVVGRSTHYDEQRARVGIAGFQPVDCLGFRIQKRPGVVNAYTLAPWLGYNVWQPMPDYKQGLVHAGLDAVEKLLSSKFKLIENAIRSR